MRNLFAFVAVAAVAGVAALYYVGKLPKVETYVGRALSLNSDLNSDPGLKTATAGDQTRVLSEVMSQSQSEAGEIEGHLLASVSGDKIKVVNEGTIPIRIMRLVRNKHYGVAWCDSDVDVNTDPSKPANFSNRVDRVLMLGESYDGIWSANCGIGGQVEVQTDRGNIVFRLEH